MMLCCQKCRNAKNARSRVTHGDFVLSLCAVLSGLALGWAACHDDVDVIDGEVDLPCATRRLVV